MLLSGINHVAVVTQDTDRFHEFYGSVFGATVFADEPTNADEGEPPGRLSFVTIGLQAESQEAFDEIRRRLIERGSTDGFVTDFGVAISLFFIDPDGLEGEVVLDKPGTGPADMRPPGTPAEGYERVLPEL
jgi:catechol-2,3-dioxygenase